MPYIELKKRKLYGILKRTMDFVLALILVVFFTPINILITIAIKLDSSGPILADTPERVGRGGKPFKMYKFRSMIQNAHEILRENPKYSRLYEKYKKGSYKLKNDPRITRVGRILRKYSLDEIPQFFNVIIGEMSIVGPRAYYPDELRDQQKMYPETQEDVKVVLSVRPGITGCWQVSGRSEINFDKRIKMDAEYVKKRSILYDISIILKTPWAMVSGRGAL